VKVTVAWFLLGALSAGCGPSLSTLVKEKRYGEAMCAAVEGTVEERGKVAEMLLEDMELALDVRVVDRERLAGVVGDGAADIADRFALLEVRTMRRRLPLSGQRVAVTSRAGAPLGAPTLTLMTGEPVPPAQPVCGRTPLAWAGNVTRRGRGDCVLTDMEPDAYRDEAPVAAALAEAFAAEQGCAVTSGAAGEHCLGYMVLDRQAKSAVSLDVHVTWWTEGGGCRLARRTAVFVVHVGDAHTIDSDVAARFARGARTLAELEASSPAAEWGTK
jgi:hypothetical protein